MDENIHHVENNILSMANDIGTHTKIISKLETAISHMTMMIEKIVPKDERIMQRIWSIFMITKLKR
jgi:hypothetical protein